MSRRPKQWLADGSKSEAVEMEALCRWLDRHPRLERYYYHVPNECVTKSERVTLSRQGVRPGIPDILIPVATPQYQGLAIELKSTSKSAKVSKHQLDWLQRFRELQYRAEVCYGAAEAIDLIMEVYGDGH